MVCHFVKIRTSCCPSCDWLQQHHKLYEIGPVLSFPHTSPAATLQPSNALWHALSSYTEKTPQNLDNLLLCGVQLWLSCMACSGQSWTGVHFYGNIKVILEEEWLSHQGGLVQQVPLHCGNPQYIIVNIAVALLI